MIKSSSKCNPKTYFSFVFHNRNSKGGRNTFYRYEYEYKICLTCMIQTGFYKKVRKILLETLSGYIPLFFSKNHFWLFVGSWYIKLWRIPLCYLFLFFKTFYASILHLKIDSLEEYFLATDIATSFTCFKPQYYTRKSSFYLFSMDENSVKPRISGSLVKGIYS